MCPVYLPMVQVPVDWSQSQRGGYYTEEARRRPLCRTQKASHSKLLRDREMPEVYRAVNLSQRTAWRVNPDILEVLDTIWEDGGGYATVPSRSEPEFPERPFDPGDAEGPEADAARERLRAWKRLVAAEIEQFQDKGSSRLRHARCLVAGKKFVGKTIYYPHFIDWRGRLYPVPQFLNHQGADLARAMLQFDQPSLAQHGSPEAGHYLAFGKDLWKGEVDEGLVREVALDPLHNDHWKDADKPWQFLAWCLEAGPWFEDEGSPIHQPIQADGTNNGLQIYSLLTRDEVMARATNVSPGDRSDIYQDVADAVWKEVMEDPSELAATWRALLPDGLDRSVVKLPVMAAPYGIRQHSAMGSMRRWLLELQKEKGVEPWGHSTYKPVKWLSDKVWAHVGNHIGPARRVMDWMRDVARTVDGPLRWTTPVDFLVTQEYPKRTKKKIKVAVSSIMKYVRYRGYGEGVDHKRQADGFAPNYIHSLDSAALMRTMGRCADRGVESFSMIHDSYGCPVGDTETMASELRDVFAEMFSENLLTKLRQEITLCTDQDIPELPALGSLDPNTVRDSKFFFA
jgi:DNA-directed RNA polymerase